MTSSLLRRPYQRRRRGRGRGGRRREGRRRGGGGRGRGRGDGGRGSGGARGESGKAGSAAETVAGGVASEKPSFDVGASQPRNVPHASSYAAGRPHGRVFPLPPCRIPRTAQPTTWPLMCRPVRSHAKRWPCALSARADTLQALPTWRWLVAEPAKPVRIHFGSIADQERARQAALKEKVRFASAHALGCSCRD